MVLWSNTVTEIGPFSRKREHMMDKSPSNDGAGLLIINPMIFILVIF